MCMASCRPGCNSTANVGDCSRISVSWTRHRTPSSPLSSWSASPIARRNATRPSTCPRYRPGALISALRAPDAECSPHRTAEKQWSKATDWYECAGNAATVARTWGRGPGRGNTVGQRNVIERRALEGFVEVEGLFVVDGVPQDADLDEGG